VSQATRASLVRRGVQVELLSLAWIVVETAVSLAAGIAAGSLLLIAFGMDSLIELASGALLLWRLLVETRGEALEQVQKAEQRASRGVAIALALLCAYLLISAAYGLLVRTESESSRLGIGIAAAAVVIMPCLAAAKRRISSQIPSEALAGDAVSSITCAFLAGTVLLGLVLHALLGWWWVENAAALAFLIWLIPETLEAFENSQSARA
jgi:divalent metal cation (Fe/Co/Zn/Cd) transporter